MEENKELSINELCKNLKFKNGRNEIVINNETDLLNYINKINQLAKDFKGKNFLKMKLKKIKICQINLYLYLSIIVICIIKQ